MKNKIVIAYGQGDGYGDGNVYLFLSEEVDILSPKKTTAKFGGKELTHKAIEALKYGGTYVHIGLPDLPKGLVVYLSNALKKVLDYRGLPL